MDARPEVSVTLSFLCNGAPVALVSKGPVLLTKLGIEALRLLVSSPVVLLYPCRRTCH